MKTILISLALAASSLLAQSPAQTKTTIVLATLTVNPGLKREDIMKHMQSEIRDTVQLYLDGRITQWFARADGKGVVFLIDAKSVDEAKTILEQLPLIKEKVATFEYMPLGPLTPLRLLMPTKP